MLIIDGRSTYRRGLLFSPNVIDLHFMNPQSATQRENRTTYMM